jgi:malonyl CoA-acyl carrier protein transacylase
MSGLDIVVNTAAFRGQEPFVGPNPEYAEIYSARNRAIHVINQCAAELTGYRSAADFVAAVAHGDMTFLNTPHNHQVANMATALTWREADKHHNATWERVPTAYVGYSQGDWTAIVAAVRGSETVMMPQDEGLFRGGLSLMKERGRLMAEASVNGGMYRIMGAGMTPEKLWAITKDLQDDHYVSLATFLNPSLAMLCGTDVGLALFAKEAAQRAKAQGMKISTVESLAAGSNRIPPAHGHLMHAANHAFLKEMGIFLDAHVKELAQDSYFVFVNNKNETVVTRDMPTIFKYLSVQMITSCLMATAIESIIEQDIKNIREYGHKSQLVKQFNRVAKAAKNAPAGVNWEDRVVMVNNREAFAK